MKFQNGLLFLILGVFVALSVSTRLNMFTEEEYKKLQGPPSEFNDFVIPGPEKNPQISNAAYIPIYLDKYGTYNGELVSDSNSLFSFCDFSSESENFQVKVALPGERQLRPLSEVLAELNGYVQTSPLGMGAAMVTTHCYSFPEPPIGVWKIWVHLPNASPDLPSPVGYWVIYNESPMVLKTYNSEDLVTGDTVNLIAVLTDETTGEIQMWNNSVSCEAYVEIPDGKTVTVQLNDKGINGDAVPHDGIFGGLIKLPQAGGYSSETVFRGLDPNGHEVLRSTLHYFAVVTSSINLQTTATAVMQDNTMIISVFISGKEEGDDTHLVYSEVWGTAADGKTEVPIAWVSGMTDRKSAGGDISTLTLTMDEKWISLSKAQAPFFLKNVRVQDRALQNQLDTEEKIPIKLQNSIPPYVYTLNVTEITKEMREGKLPRKYQNRNATFENHKLLLIHGYCADGPPYTQTDFTDYLVFDDPYANRNLDEFVQLIQQFVKDNSVDMFSIVAHSQGGLASLHLNTYYFSGLDLATTGRKIQSVGSPYQGTALAGGLASIGRVFGYGCGANDGLTKAGAAEWLAGVPNEKRADIYYLTTEGTSSCSTGANFVGLESPNDGVVAKQYGQLPGANNEGHLVGWCHSTGFSSASQCQNHDNNKKMNSLAAR